MKLLMTTMQMEIGGAETHIFELAKSLALRGHDVTIASSGGVYVKQLEEIGVHHVTLPLHTHGIAAMVKSYFGLRKLILSERYDIVHAHARIPAFLCGLLARRYHFRFMTSAHGMFKVTPLLRFMTDWGEASVAVSNDLKQYLIDEYEMSPDRISVTINGIDTERFSPSADGQAVKEEFSLSDSAFRVVYVSRIDKEVAHAGFWLCDAAERLYEELPTLEILMVGGGTAYDELLSRASAVNEKAGRTVVRLTGPRTDIPELVAAGSVFVGVSRAALEAMAVQHPVILAGAQGYIGIFREEKERDAFETNFCCRGLEAADGDKLAQDIRTLYRMSKEEREALGRYCRSVVVKRYSVERMTDDYLAMYETLRPFRPASSGDILICGYYGFRNMGDDSLLRAIVGNLRAIDPDVRITVMSRSPAETRRLYGTNAVNRFHPFAVFRAMKRAKLLIFGGGNLLQDGSSTRSLWYYTNILKIARKFGLKIMVYANGIGPLYKEKSRQQTAKALSAADRITLREKDSYELCRKLGISEERLSLTADPAFTLKPTDPAWVEHLCERFGMKAEKKYFVVALRAWKKDDDENRREMAALCDKIHEKYGYIPVFLPMHEQLDGAVNRGVRALCTCETLFVSGVTGGEMLGLLEKTEFVIAMRLHTLIYASSVGVPSIGLTYDSKLKSFMDFIGLPYVLDEPDMEKALDLVSELLKNRNEIRSMLSGKKEIFIKEAYRDAETAFALLGTKGKKDRK